MLGTWYGLHDNADKAKACFRPAILQGIDMWKEDDPDNDMEGYVNLAKTLLHAGDMRNASTAFAVSVAPLDPLKAERKDKTSPNEVLPSGARAKGSDDGNGVAADLAVALDLTASLDITSEGVTPPLNVSNNDLIPDTIPTTMQPKENGATESTNNPIEAHEPTKHETTVEEDDTPADFPFECDGLCHPTVTRGVHDFSAFYHCEICRDNNFCDQFLECLKAGGLMRRICNPDHTFYRSYPLPTQLEDVGVVNVGGKILPRPSWLQELREAWAA